MTDKKNKLSERRIAPELPSGFRDYSPTETIAKQAMIDTIRTTFELFGFDPLETSSVQRTEVLTGGEEDSGKIIFNVKGSQEKESDSSLRFDLTVPLARFMAANQDIPKPFKRYQIGTVWRGERSQAGRYREFMQADVDIVGSSSLDADAEIIGVIYATLKNLGIDDFLIKINDRKELQKLPAFAGFAEEKLWPTLRIIDKLDKIGERGVQAELVKEIGDTAAKKVARFLNDTTSANGNLADLLEPVRQINITEQYCRVDRSLVRGLSYYTGAVFETILTTMPEIGSIFSGGRYDDLVARFTGQPISAVGASIGVDRLFAALEKLGKADGQGTKTRMLILQLDELLKNEYLAMAQELRGAGMNTALYLGDDRAFQAQLAYAVKKEIPFVIIYGDQEKRKDIVTIKNLATREQQE
ncbi:MAG: histidine--tRNA ligase, partial [Candidatus Sungbacteria bacterium]|nr:histidine--tRNA ligase [Candidatus Sungbacteria bacterium]